MSAHSMKREHLDENQSIHDQRLNSAISANRSEQKRFMSAHSKHSHAHENESLRS
jgi:hypothetical protein